jgi:hypothetical protein
MLQLQTGGRRGTSPLQLSRLQARQGIEAKEKVAEGAKDYNGKGVLFQPHHVKTILRRGATQQQPQPQQPPSVHTPVPQQWEKLVPNQTSNANSSSLNDMFTVVATILQQILTEFNWAESEEDRIMDITKIVVKLMKQNDRQIS